MPKILRIVNRFNLGGPTYSVAYLTKYLPDEFEIKLIGGKKDDFEQGSEFILEGLGVEYSIIDSMRREINFSQDRKAYKEIKKIIKEFKPDIIHTHAAKAGAIGRLAAIKMNVPVIVHTFHGHVFHSYFGKLKTYAYKFIERYLAKRSSAIITLSEEQDREICDVHKICPRSKTKVVGLGFDLSRFGENKAEKRTHFRSMWDVEADTTLIGIVGRVVPIKNHKLYLRVLREVINQSDQKIQGMIIGDGDATEEIIDFASSIGLSVSIPEKKLVGADVIFTSWIKKIDEANAGMDIAMLTSLNEGTPVSLIEAQAASLPFVSTDVGGVKDIAVPNESGFIHSLEDVNGLIESTLRLVKEPGLRNQMGKVGLEFGLEKFHYTRFCSQMTNIYKELLNDFDSINK